MGNRTRRTSKKKKGGGCFWPVTFLLVCGITLFWWRGGSDGVKSLAERLPAESIAGWAVDGANPEELADWSKDAATLLAAHLGEDDLDWSKFEESLGMDLQTWAQLFNGRSYAGTLAQDGELLRFTAVGLADSKGFAEWWQTIQKEQTTEFEVAGVSFQKLGKSEALGWDDDWVYLSNGEASAQRFLDFANSGGDSLADNESFQEGFEALKVDNCDGFLFFNVQSAIAEAKVADTKLDKQVATELATFRYALGTIDFETWEVRGILATQEEPTGVAAKICIPGTVRGDALARLADGTQNYACLDLKWVQDVTVGLLSLNDKTRYYATMISMGMLAKGNPWSGLKGEVAFTTDLPSIMAKALETLEPQELARALQSDKPSLVVSAAVSDISQTHSLLKSYFSLPGAPPEPGEEQDYPAGPDGTLRLSDTKPPALLLMAGTNSEKLLAQSSGANKNPAIKDSLEWAGEGVVYIDHWDATKIVESLTAGLEGRDDRKSVATLNFLKRLKKRFPSVHGSSCLVASKEGLKYRSIGPLNSAVVASFAGVSTLFQKKQKRTVRRRNRQNKKRKKRGKFLNLR